MGRRSRPFVDKSKSETYQLIYRSTDEATASSERVFVDRDRRTAETSTNTAARRQSIRWGVEDEALTEEQKKEIKDLGLSSDGYNYLKHLRSLGKGRFELPVESDSKSNGVFVQNDDFVPPEPEKRVVSAKALTIAEAIEDEEKVEDSMRTSTTRAFSRIVPHVKGGTTVKEIEDVEALMSAFEEMHVEGDLLDTFVIDATQMGDEVTIQRRQGRVAFPENLSSDEEWELESESEGRQSKAKSIGRSRFSRDDAESCGTFSERWKGFDPSDFEGRRQRTRGLEIVDEAFEVVLESYDESDTGDLEDVAEDGMSLEQLARLLHRHAPERGDGFRPVDQNEEKDGEKKKRPPKRLGDYKLMKPKSRTVALNDKDAKVLEATKRLMDSKGVRNKREEWSDIWISVRSEKELDCESAWSSRTHSTVHQPVRISTSSKPTQLPISTDPVIISKKTGLPVESEASDASMSDTEASDLFLVRSKEETTDEKRRRKSAVKEAQREARRRKKETKQLFRREQTRQQKQFAGMLSKNASVIEL